MKEEGQTIPKGKSGTQTQSNSMGVTYGGMGWGVLWGRWDGKGQDVTVSDFSGELMSPWKQGIHPLGQKGEGLQLSSPPTKTSHVGSHVRAATCPWLCTLEPLVGWRLC